MDSPAARGQKNVPPKGTAGPPGLELLKLKRVEPPTTESVAALDAVPLPTGTERVAVEFIETNAVAGPDPVLVNVSIVEKELPAVAVTGSAQAIDAEQQTIIATITAPSRSVAMRDIIFTFPSDDVLLTKVTGSACIDSAVKVRTPSIETRVVNERFMLPPL